MPRLQAQAQAGRKEHMKVITDIKQLPNTVYPHVVKNFEEAEKLAGDREAYYYETKTLKHKYLYFVERQAK